MVCIGYASQPVEMDTKLIVRKELAVLGSRNAREEFRSVVTMLEARERPFTEMISRLVPLAQTPQTLAKSEGARGGADLFRWGRYERDRACGAEPAVDTAGGAHRVRG
jgi:threonine dehydrogenase-like Zn-dependent dehydrogenase